MYAPRGLVCLEQTATASVPRGGFLIRPPFRAEHSKLVDQHQDRTDRTVDVYYPSPAHEKGANRRFPMISYAHGYSGGGPVNNIAYGELLRGLAGFGYIVVAPRACDYGCECQKQCSLPGDPDGFQAYYRTQLRALEWAREALTCEAPPWMLKAVFPMRWSSTLST